jgi:hypothetical protein
VVSVSGALGRGNPGTARIASVAIIATLAGGVVGGWLDFQAWHSNGAFYALAVKALAVLIAVVAAIAWRSGSRGARTMTLGAVAFAAGAIVGGWIAPSAYPPQWSPGFVRLDMTAPVVATSSGPAACWTSDDGAIIVGSEDGQAIAAGPVWYEVSAPGADRNSGAPSFALVVTPSTAAAETRWDSNTEAGVEPDQPAAHTLEWQGTAAAGNLTFLDVPRSADTPGDGALGSIDAVAVSGMVAWTCEPPRGVPTPIEGSWFR